MQLQDMYAYTDHHKVKVSTGVKKNVNKIESGQSVKQKSHFKNQLFLAVVKIAVSPVSDHRQRRGHHPRGCPQSPPPAPSPRVR